MRLAGLALLVLVALAGFTGVARSAIGEGGLTHAQQLTQERAERRAELQAERAAARQLQRQSRASKEEERENEKKLRHERNFGVDGDAGHVAVNAECTSATLVFSKFPPGTHNFHEVVTIMHDHKREPGSRVTLPYSFDGPESTQVVNLPAVFLGQYTVDVQGTSKGVHFDIGSGIGCGPTPRFTVEKFERLGATGEYVKGPLTGHVGEVVHYAIVVRNTGNVPLEFSALSDPNCDPNTIAGGPTGPVEPGASAQFTCSHTLTEADLQAGSYSNVATIACTSAACEGLPSGEREQTTNTVVVELTATTPPAGPQNPPPSNPPNNGGSNGVAGAVFAGGGIGSSTGPSTGVLTFVQTTAPSLRGPQGCVRNTFKATVKAKGVSTVSFYLDGHKLRTMSARAAKRGLFTISINTSRLRVGAHRLTAKIVMAKVASSSKQVKASRSLTFVRCASAAVRPKFTG